MRYFWIIVGCIEVLIVRLLLFGLLTTRVARLQRRAPAFAVLAAFIVCVVGSAVLAIGCGTRIFVVGSHFTAMKNLLIVTTVVYCIGNVTIGWFGLRRHVPDTLPAAATWPRSRLLLAFLVALSLSIVTHWNVTLSVQQHLAREEVEARVMAMSVVPGRPIDPLNAAILYEPVFQRLPEHKAVQDDWLDFDKPLDTDDPVLRELLANHRRDLEVLVQATARPQCHFGTRQPLDLWDGDRDYDWLGRMVVAARIRAVDTRVRISEGDLKGTANSTSAMFRIARHLDQTPILVGILASRTIDVWAIDCKQALLNHPDLSPETLSGMHLDPLTDYRRILRRVSVFEEARATTLVRRIPMAGFDHLGSNLRDEIGDPGKRIAAYLWKATSPYCIEHELAVFRSTHRKYRELLDQPWSEASVQFVKFGAVRHRGGLTTALMPKWWEHEAARLMIDNARHRQARLAIALRRYDLESGSLPESFDDLIPAYMEEVPLDPTIKEPFGMENVDGGIRLYSAEIESWNPEEYPGNVIKETNGKVEMFLKSRQ